MASRGDLVECAGERGVVCCTDPLVMRCVEVHAYVPLRPPVTVLERGHDPSCSLRDEVRKRIRRYLSQSVSEGDGAAVPTGAGSA